MDALVALPYGVSVEYLCATLYLICNALRSSVSIDPTAFQNFFWKVIYFGGHGNGYWYR